MIDAPKQIQYWLRGAEEDWSVARICLENGKVRHALFLAHLALEKALKAHVCAVTQSVPPKIHNLRRLYELAELPAIKPYHDALANMNQFNIEGRYPEFMPVELEMTTARVFMNQAEEVYQWLIKQL